MLPINLALVSTVPSIGLSALTKVSAALQKQVTRDFTPMWAVIATVDPFTALKDVPLGYWPIIVVDTFEHGGQHRDRNNQPFALVAAGSSWSLVASHEALEMLADPFGNRLVVGDSPMPAQGRVEFLVEVCDPCQLDDFAYTVNGVLVSDFCTPSYFDPVGAPGVRYSFTGAVSAPRDVLEGGYLSWREPTSGHWFQQKRKDGDLQIKDLGLLPPGNNSLRAMIDELSPETRKLGRLAKKRPSMRQSAARLKSGAAGSAERARDIRKQIARGE